jgi:hypothetical protein
MSESFIAVEGVRGNPKFKNKNTNTPLTFIAALADEINQI